MIGLLATEDGLVSRELGFLMEGESEAFVGDILFAVM